MRAEEHAIDSATPLTDDGEEADSILRVEKLSWASTLGWLIALIAPWWRRGR